MPSDAKNLKNLKAAEHKALLEPDDVNQNECEHNMKYVKTLKNSEAVLYRCTICKIEEVE